MITFSYDRLTRLCGGMWFMLLAFCVMMGIRMRVAAAVSLSDLSPSLLSSICLSVFYFILALLIIFRPPAAAQSKEIVPKAAAFVGTYLPWTITFFVRTDAAAPDLISSVLVITGTVLMLVTISHLGRSFSLVPQARSVVQSGPYRLVRHPLYLAEAIAVSGAVLQYLSLPTVLIFVAFILVQIFRITYEEKLLADTFPAYSAYAASRWRLIPYVW